MKKRYLFIPAMILVTIALDIYTWHSITDVRPTKEIPQTISAPSEPLKSPRTVTSTQYDVQDQEQAKHTVTPIVVAKNVPLSSNPEVAKLIAMVNAERKKAGLKPVKENGKLDRGAQWKSEDMNKNQYWAHHSSTGMYIVSWLEKTGYSYSSAGENLAMGFSDNESVIAAWMASPTHRANILDSDFTETGIGIKEGTFEGKETTFVTEFFALPYVQ